MSEHKTLIEMIEQSGMAPKLPKRLEPAVKFVNPNFTTYGGFSWWGHGKWVKSPDETFNPTTCEPGGLHVANTMAAAQSGGARPTHCLWVGVDPAEAGVWEDGKRKAPRVYVAGPIDLIEIIRRHGNGADLTGAYLSGAYLSRAYLSRADLTGADLTGADLYGANLARADLYGAYLHGTNLVRANLSGAYGRDDWDELVKRGAIR